MNWIIAAAVLFPVTYWVAYQLLSLVVGVLGVLLFPLLWCVIGYDIRPTLCPRLWPGRNVESWRGGWLTALWGNEEDGIFGPYLTPGPITAATAFEWTILRNFANGMRLLPGASFMIHTSYTFTWGPVSLCFAGGWRWALWIGDRHAGWLIKPNAQAGWLAWPVAG